MKIVPRLFYQRPTDIVAQELLGKIVVRVLGSSRLMGIISETEAYGGDNDPASHAYGKQTMRNTPMFGSVGQSYIYFIYGNHHCLNVVAKERGVAAGAVLIRGIIPIFGVQEMIRFCNITNIHTLTNGPGKVTRALQLTREHNCLDMTKKGALYIAEGPAIDLKDICVTPRIGIKKAQDKLWRFVIKKEVSANLVCS